MTQVEINLIYRQDFQHDSDTNKYHTLGTVTPLPQTIHLQIPDTVLLASDQLQIHEYVDAIKV